MYKEFPITVDLKVIIRTNEVVVNTNDVDSLKLNISIKDNGKPVNLTGSNVRIAIQKPDRKSVLQDCEITNGPEGKCSVILANQAYLVPGDHKAELMIHNKSDSENIITTYPFKYTSTKGIMNDNAIESENDLSAIAKVLQVGDRLEGVDPSVFDNMKDLATKTDLTPLATKTELKPIEDEVKKNAEQLADTVKEVNGVKPTNGKVTLPIPEVDTSNLRTKTEKLSLEDMSPETLAAIEGGEGTSFNLLSIPQDKSVTPEKTSFIETQIGSTNLLDYSKVELDGYYAWNTGQWSVRTDIATTGLIKCSPGDTFAVGSDQTTAGGNVTFWNANHQYVSGQDVTKAPFAVPTNPNIAYFRISFYKSFALRTVKIYKVNKGTELLPYENYRPPNYALKENIKVNMSMTGYPNPEEMAHVVERVNNSYLDQVSFFNQYGEVSIQEGRDIKYGTSYWLLRINRETFDGKIILPKLKFTSTSVNDPSTTDVKTFNDKNNYVTVINAGIFNTDTNISDGIIIQDGNIVQDKVSTTHQNQYTLAINNSGVMRAYASNVTAATILADGNRHALVGFVPIIENNQIVADSILRLCPHADADNPRQIIGQLANNDYIVCSFDGRSTGEAGLTLKECAEILLNYGVKFAYNLDGGGSTQTFVSKKRINRLIENRKVPNVIVFEKQA